MAMGTKEEGVARQASSQKFIRETLRGQLAPVMMTVLLVQLCSIANNLIVGRLLGAEALAVMSAVSPVSFTFATLGSLLCVGGSLLSAEYLGKNEFRRADFVFTLSFAALAAFSLLATAAGLVFKGALMDFLGVPEALRADASSYLGIYLGGSVASVGIYLPFNYLKLVGRQRAAMGVFAVMAAVDLFLAVYLVGARGLGMAGVAFAIVAGAGAAFVLGSALLLARGDFHLCFLPGAAKELLHMLRLGSPAAINNLCNTFRSLILNRILIAGLGSWGLTAFGVISTITSLSITITSGASQTLAPFVSFFSGERDVESIRQSFRQTFKVSLLLICAFAALAAAFRIQICELFKSSDPSLLRIAGPAIAIYAVSLPFAMVNYLLIGVNQANHRTRLANLLTVLRGFALVIASALLINRFLGPGAVWWCFLLAEIGTLGLYALIACRVSARNPHTSRFLLLDTEAEQSGRYIAFSVPANDEAAVQSAERVTAFCEENGLPRKTVMVMGLALEEIIVLLNAHVFKELPGADVSTRVLIVNGHATMRIRCGGRRFNPIAYATQQGDDLESDSLGIRMIDQLAMYVDYQSTFGINNLTIVL